MEHVHDDHQPVENARTQQRVALAVVVVVVARTQRAVREKRGTAHR